MAEGYMFVSVAIIVLGILTVLYRLPIVRMLVYTVAATVVMFAPSRPTERVYCAKPN